MSTINFLKKLLNFYKPLPCFMDNTDENDDGGGGGGNQSKLPWFGSPEGGPVPDYVHMFFSFLAVLLFVLGAN
jgi:hypothetical protein